MKTIFTIFSLLLIFTAQAQWTTNTDVNTLVVDSEGGDMQALGTSDGKTYVVFWESVSAPTNYELRMQVLDAEGNQTLGSNGVLVSDQIPMSTFTVLWNIVVDADDNLYIGVTGTTDFSAYAFKMDVTGTQLWGANGISLGTGVPVNILPLSSGDAIVSWHDSGAAVMRKFDSSGSAIWPGTKTIGTGNTTAANMFELSNNDFEVVYHSILSGINSFLYAQKYNEDGDPQWANSIQIADRTTAFNRTYTGVQDGDVVYMGYFASAGLRFDSYLQRINPDGTLPWGINGADFDTNETNYETYTQISFQPGSQYIWSICTYTDDTQSQVGEYVQKFDKATGAREFTDNAKEIYPLGSDKVHAGSLHLKNDSPLFLIKDGFDSGASPVTLNALYLDENGDFTWPEETRPVATFPASKSRIQYTKPVNNQSVAVFIEDKGDGPKIYAQNFIDEELGISDYSEISILFANPVKDELVLKSGCLMNNISIFNMLGQQLFYREYNDENAVAINSQNWKSGIYFMNVSTNEGLKKGIKLIKK